VSPVASERRRSSKATCKVFDVERMLLRHVHALTAVWLR
jgi:hypothetical protein